MAGKIRRMIDEIVEKKSRGNQILGNLTRTKIILKGINVNSYDAFSDDDLAVINQLRQIAREFNVSVY